MTNVFEIAERRIDRLKSGGPIDPTGGGGDNGDMETRVARLEDFAEKTGERLGRVDEKLVRVETKLDHIEKEVSNFKWWVIAQIVAALLTVVGTGVAIQQMTVATFQAAGQQAPAPQQPPIIINVPGAAQPPSK